MTTTLKPCPFCGGAAQEDTWSQPNYVEYRVECSKCDVRMHEFTRDKANAKWNQRTHTPVVVSGRPMTLAGKPLETVRPPPDPRDAHDWKGHRDQPR